MMLHGAAARFYLITCPRLIVFLVLPLLPTQVFSQLKAAFSANTTEGCAPLLVRFRDESSGNPTAYKWYLGNNITPHIDKDPSTTYINPGTYTVKLVIRNATNTADSVEKMSYIRVWATPIVNFRASDSSGCYPAVIQFTDLSSPGDGTITKWLWDFGDGNTSTETNPTHEYSSRGNYNVTLRIINSHGCDKTFSKIEYIRLQSGVQADFTFTAPNTCKAPTPVTFINNSTGTGTLRYDWQFGDNIRSSDKNPSHVYTQAGSYSIRLITTNDAGCRDTLLKSNAINIGSVKADFSVPEEVCEGAVISLQNSSEPPAVGSSWNFGDGTTSSVLHPSKTYTRPGKYTITLTSNFGSCTDVVSRNITVLPKPLAAFSATGNVSCQLPFTVNFNNTSEHAINYLWDFGDGSTSTAQDPAHTYTRSGRFNVSLKVNGSNGCSTTAVSNGLVKGEPLQVSVVNLPVKGCAPLVFVPQVIINSIDSIGSYEWHFGDGHTSSEALPQYTYNTPGKYDVKLIIKTVAGCIDSVVYPAAIQVGIKPTVAFSATPRETCAFSPVKFKDESTGAGINEWFWEFGDGGSSTAQHPTHNYSDTGYFPVLLTVYNNGCKNELLLNDYIRILPPIAKFDININSCSDTYNRKFINQSIGATSWSWDFGDGKTSVEKDPEHNYSRTGIFKVTLTVKNQDCEHTIIRQVQILDEQPQVAASDTLVCKNNPVTFTISNINPLNLNFVVWDYGDGSTQRIFSNTSKHSYLKTGIYSLRAIVHDINGCTDTVVKKQYITVQGPVADFTTAKNAVCRDGLVSFTDLSKAEQGVPLKEWRWQYGDGESETLTSAPFQHIYKKPGAFTVTLKITDSMGCVDQVSKNGMVLISNPIAAFISPDSLSCNNQNIRFVNQSTGTALTYNWSFGDGNAGNALFQPNHSYSSEGSYSVQLVVMDSYGCTDSLTKLNYIQIKNPKADLAVNDSVASCPPLVAAFKNNSTHFSSYQWDFGDRTSSAIDNPTHIYNYPGKYTARLIITSRGGCRDTAEQTMIVRGPQGEFFYPDTLACVPATITFRGSSKDDVTFIWDYNNGNTEFTTDSSVSYRYDAPGLYYPKMILVDAQGCKVSIAGTRPLELKGVLAKFGLSKQVLCDSGLVQLRDQSVTYEKVKSYHWTFGDGSMSTAKDPDHYYKTAGRYPIQLNVVTETGCTDTVDVLTNINVANSPLINIAGPAELCAPAVFQLNGELLRTDTGTLDWSWDLGNGRKTSIINPQVITAGEGTTLVNAIATSVWGCSDTAYKNLVTRPIPKLDGGADTVTCYGSAVTLQAKGADRYKWDAAAPMSCTDCASPVITPANNVRLYVIGETIYGCKATDSLFIEVKKPFRLQVTPADTICVGSSIQLNARGAELHRWSPGAGLNNTNIANPLAKPSVSTVYQVIGTDVRHCFTDTAYVPVMVYPYPTVTAGEDKSILVGNHVQLDGKVSADVNLVRWSPNNGLDCTNCPNPVAAPKSTTNYQVSVSNEGGCTASDEVTVSVLCNQGNLFIPNTFSPNGDGNNDVFYPRGKGLYGVKSLKIFNRWGEVIFERSNFQANDISSGWNGKFNGKESGQDVYVYTIDIVCENNSVLTFKGNVALLR